MENSSLFVLLFLLGIEGVAVQMDARLCAMTTIATMTTVTTMDGYDCGANW